MDEKGSVAMAWKLANAFPSKITVTDMNANGNEAVVESMELAHEGLTLAGQ
ncbi:MAG TPA: phage tail protein [Ferruginibacter sp.]|nr:phage tail protein [Ferruginibacter sp.]